jgi:cell wall-associated NlpC family hydrolase
VRRNQQAWGIVIAVVVGAAAAGQAKTGAAGHAAATLDRATSSAAHTAHLAHLAQAAALAAKNSQASRAVAAAESRQGDPYVYTATGPDAFDCSGLTMWAYAQVGVSIPRTSEQDWADLPHLKKGDRPEPGDLIIYTGSPIDPPPGHVTMYVGRGRMVEAEETGVPVHIVPVRAGAWGYVRPVGGV